jgi:sugar phosphate isomerase/epimerase
MPTHSLRHATCNEAFEKWDFADACRAIRKIGYTGIEIAPFTMNVDAREITARQRAEVCRQADAAGLEVVGLHWLLAKTTGGYHLTSPDAAVRRKTADYVGALARLCHDLGGRTLVFGSPQQRNVLPGVTPTEATDHAAEVIEACLPVLEETGVILCMEPLAPAEGNFLNTAAEGARLVERVGHPQCRLILDCKAMSSEPKPIPQLIERHAGLLEHFHANDPNKQGPGFGDLDFVPIFEALGKIDFRGWVSVEVFDYSPGVERLASESIDNMRAALEQLAGKGEH